MNIKIRILGILFLTSITYTFSVYGQSDEWRKKLTEQEEQLKLNPQVIRFKDARERNIKINIKIIANLPGRHKGCVFQTIEFLK